MLNRGFTPEGQRALGQLIKRCRCSDAVRNRVAQWAEKEHVATPVSQEQFARWLSAVSGIAVSESAIGRLERGEGRSGPPLGVLIILCRMEVLRVEGEVCDLNRVVGVLCGEG